MEAKKFFAYSVVYILAVGVSVFLLNSGDYTLNVYNYKEITLPVAVWIILPTLILAIFASLHLSFHSIKIFFERRNIKNDFNTFLSQAKSNLLGSSDIKSMKTPWFKLPSQMFAYFGVWGDMSVGDMDNEEIREIGKIVAKIKSGEYIDIKKYKLDKNNPLVLQNEENHLKNDPKSAIELLRIYTNIKDGIGKIAFDTFIDNASLTDIKKTSFKLEEKSILRIFERFNDTSDDMELEIKDVEYFLTDTKMQKSAYIKSAKLLKNKLNPDGLIALFESLSQKNLEANEAYMYILYEFQMLDKLREILENSDQKEYQNFKTLLFLRDNSRSIDSSLLI